ncbi:MAG: hypothetical protein JWQ96_1558 [Segetibacter sp.]|nr:hypothetical protein [Segetibacter sp.]
MDKQSEHVGEPRASKEKMTDDFYGRGSYAVDVYHFSVQYKFSCSPVIFKVQPTSWAMVSEDITVNDRLGTVSFSIKIYQQDAQEFINKKNESYRRAFLNLESINGNIRGLNNILRGIITEKFDSEKQKYLKENDFFQLLMFA